MLLLLLVVQVHRRLQRQSRFLVPVVVLDSARIIKSAPCLKPCLR